MTDFILSESAKKDLRNITTYTMETWSETQAIKYYNILLDACEYLASRQSPVGRSYDGIRPDLYGFHCARHIIFYRYLSSNRVRIVRILHERMDYPRHL